jgi:hypothetical protein
LFRRLPLNYKFKIKIKILSALSSSTYLSHAAQCRSFVKTKKNPLSITVGRYTPPRQNIGISLLAPLVERRLPSGSRTTYGLSNAVVKPAADRRTSLNTCSILIGFRRVLPAVAFVFPPSSWFPVFVTHHRVARPSLFGSDTTSGRRKAEVLPHSEWGGNEAFLVLTTTVPMVAATPGGTACQHYRSYEKPIYYWNSRMFRAC